MAKTKLPGVGLLANPEIIETDLDALYAYDHRIIDKLGMMDRAARDCRSAAQLHDWDKQMDDLEKLIEERKHYIGKVRT